MGMELIIPTGIKSDKQKECGICQRPFILIHRPRRHCKNCQMTICKSCSSQKLRIHEDKEEERVCDKCIKILSVKDIGKSVTESIRVSDVQQTGILLKDPSSNSVLKLLSVLNKRWLRE